QWTPQIAANILREPIHFNSVSDARHIGIAGLGLQRSHVTVDAIGSLRGRYAFFEASEHAQIHVVTAAAESVGTEHERNPGRGRGRKTKLRGCDADDAMRLIVQHQNLPEHAAAGAECGAPES